MLHSVRPNAVGQVVDIQLGRRRDPEALHERREAPGYTSEPSIAGELWSAADEGLLANLRSREPSVREYGEELAPHPDKHTEASSAGRARLWWSIRGAQRGRRRPAAACRQIGERRRLGGVPVLAGLMPLVLRPARE